MRPRFVQGNRLRLLKNGSEYFPALLEAIRASQRDIFIETYIFADDETGRAVAQSLSAAAERGVAVHLLVDGFGSKEIIPQLASQLLAPQVKVQIYHPQISPFTLSQNPLHRLHRKLVVVDGQVAFIGGINIIDDMHTPGLLPPRYDYAVRIEGPLLARIVSEAVRLWNRATWINLHWQWLIPRRAVLATAAAAAVGEQRVALVVRDNLLHRGDIEEAYLAALDQAREEVLIANAYFLPGLRFRRALLRAAERGVRVVLLLQGRQEYLLLHYATRALYGRLLDAGVEIYEYHKGFMHAKVAVVDQAWATVGSSNIDPFSLLLAREANLIVDDLGFAAELRQSLLCHIREGAQVVAKTMWHHRPLSQRAIIWCAYGITRLLIGLAGYAGRH